MAGGEMITKRDALWGMVGVVSLTVFLIAAWQIFTATSIPWISLLIVMIMGGIAGGIPRLPESIMARYRMLWLSLGLAAWGILLFWQGSRSLRFMGLSTAWLVAATGYFCHRWRSRNVPVKSEITPGDSRNAESHCVNDV